PSANRMEALGSAQFSSQVGTGGWLTKRKTARHSTGGLLLGAGTRLIANYFARIVVEVLLLRLTPKQRRALYTSWPLEGLAGQRPRRVKRDYGTVAVCVWQ